MIVCFGFLVLIQYAPSPQACITNPKLNNMKSK